MSLIHKFNESYNASGGHDLITGMYSAFSYGSNSFCPDQLQQLLTTANNDRAPEAPPPKALAR